MDIVYDISSNKILHVFNTTGEFNNEGSIRKHVLADWAIKNKRDFADFALWPFVGIKQRAKLPSDFYNNFSSYSVMIDDVLKQPYGVEKGSSKYILNEIHHDGDIPILWNGGFFDTISYSLINRRFVLGLKRRGENIKIVVSKRANTEVPKEEQEELESIMISPKDSAKIQDAIRLFCFLPVERALPAKYNISFTMMETDTVNSSLVNTLNSYSNECWFPCLDGNSVILTERNEMLDFSIACNMSAKRLGNARTHTNKYQKIKKTSVRKYTGIVHQMHTVFMKDHLRGTPEHPIYVARYKGKNTGEDVQLLGKECIPMKDVVKTACYLIYPRDINNDPNKTLELHKMALKGEFLDVEGEYDWDKLMLYHQDRVYNHLLEKESPCLIAFKDDYTLFKNLEINNNLVELFAIFSLREHAEEVTTKKGKFYQIEFRTEELRTAFYERLIPCLAKKRASKKFIFYSRRSFLVRDAYSLLINNEYVVWFLNEYKTWYKYFNQDNKRTFLRCLKQYALEDFYGYITIKFTEKKDCFHMLKFCFDCGIVASYWMKLNRVKLKYKKKNSHAVQFTPEQYQIFENVLSSNTDSNNYLSKGATFVVTPEEIHFRILFKYSKEETLLVHNMEVKNDNSYIANFAAVHNCNFNAQKFSQAGVKQNISQIPLGVDEHIYVPHISRTDKYKFVCLNNTPENSFSPEPAGFKFLSIFRCSYRKGPDVLIKAFQRAFTKNDGVCLIIFSRHYWGNVQNEKMDTVAATKDYLCKWIKDNPDSPPIYWCGDYIKDEDMPHVYGWGDCYVSTSRGEGFGLTLLEAGACNIPIIAPNHSGFSEYMNHERGYIIDTDGYENIGKIEFQNGKPQYVGDNEEWAVWITPAFRDQEFPIMGEQAVAQTAFLMRRVITNYEEAKAKAVKMREFILDNFTWDKCIDKVSKRIKEIKMMLKGKK